MCQEISLSRQNHPTPASSCVNNGARNYTCSRVYNPVGNMWLCLRTETERKTVNSTVHFSALLCPPRQISKFFPLRLMDKLDKLSGIVSELVKVLEKDSTFVSVMLINSPFAQKEDFRKIEIDHVFTVYLPLHLS